MQKFFIAKMKDQTVSFHEIDAHHILKVMRLTTDDQVIGIYDQQKYLCQITTVEPLRAIVIEKLIDDTTNNFNLNLFQASIKPNAMELAIIKACELNVTNFYIFNAQLSQGHLQHNLERYRKLIKTASEQANRNQLMNLKVLSDNDALVTTLAANDINLIAHFNPDNHSLSSVFSPALKNIGIMIGPEGGFNDTEINFLISQKGHIINLTKTILRAETASLYLISVVSYLMLKEDQ